MKLTEKNVDEDPAGCQRWISGKEIKSVNIQKNKSKDYCKADNNVCCFFRTIFRLATPAFFRFTDGTELMTGEGGGGNGVQHKKERKK